VGVAAGVIAAVEMIYAPPDFRGHSCPLRTNSGYNPLGHQNPVQSCHHLHMRQTALRGNQRLEDILSSRPVWVLASSVSVGHSSCYDRSMGSPANVIIDPKTSGLGGWNSPGVGIFGVRGTEICHLRQPAMTAITTMTPSQRGTQPSGGVRRSIGTPLISARGGEPEPVLDMVFMRRGGLMLQASHVIFICFRRLDPVLTKLTPAVRRRRDQRYVVACRQQPLLAFALSLRPLCH
jgi:hypothetical protein